MKTKGKLKNKSGRKSAFFIAIILVCFSLTIGYSAFSDEFTITDIVAHVRVFKLVRVNGVTTNSGAVSNLDYNSNSILNTVYIPAGQSVTYSVTATNLGNVPVAVSQVSFSNGNGNVSNLTSNISPTPGNYVKVCDTNDNCTNGVSKTFDVTITNNGSSAINGELDVNLTFTEVYKIYYDGTELGEALAGSNYTYEFTSNPPSKLSKSNGNCDSFNYANNILTVNNVQSDIEFTEAHTITYNGSVLGYANDGATYTKTFDSEWPYTITKNSGTCDSDNYDFQTHTLTLTNVQSDISLTGTIGKVEISNISYVSSKNVVTPLTNPNYHDLDVDFSVTFRKEEGSQVDGFEIVYQVALTNTHYDDYIFRGFDFHPTVTASSNDDTAYLTLTPTGIANGDVIESGDTRTFTVTLTLITNNDTGSYDTSSSAGVDTTPDTEEETGDITATISPNTGDLRSPLTRAEFTVTVTNTYPSDREFTLLSSNSNLEIVNSSNNPIGNLTVRGNDTQTYTVYVKAVQGAQFVSNTDTMTMYLSSDCQPNATVGNLTFNVDKHDVPDTTKVTVGNVTIDYYRSASGEPPEVGSVYVTWDRKDYGGTPISDYVVQLFKQGQSTAAYTESETSSARTYKFTNVAAGSYYAVVYGIDSATPTPNSGASYVSSATTADGYASRSNGDTPFSWEFNVDTSGIQNLTVAVVSPTTDKAKAYREQVYSITVTAQGTTGFAANEAPNNLTVKMGATAATAVTLTKDTDYTYTKNNTRGTLAINKGVINNNLYISGNHIEGCLIEGTKIKLANGKYKNIEDINYDDLLLTYSYETGEFVYEYPIWIEKATVADHYQVNTFSDGTVLKTYGYHGVFETELNRFVSVDKPEEFHVGSKIAKLKEDGSGFETVTVTNIEYKNEYVAYYHVVSTRYYNIIANDLITTDGTTVLSNLYGFTDNMTWPKEVRKYAMQDVYSYSDLADAIPYYMFKGLRAEEGKLLSNYGLDLDTFKGYLIKNQNNPDMLRIPIQKNGKNMWMVTTNLDNINEFNKRDYLREEGSIYTLPKVNDKKFIGWLNYADNKMYNPGEQIEVYYGMHFEAVFGK